MTIDLLKQLVSGFVIDAKIIFGQLTQESANNKIATRQEPVWIEKFKKQGFSERDSIILGTSWGLYQIMGYNIKALGYDVLNDKWLNSFLDSETLQTEVYKKFSLPVWKNVSGNVNHFLASYNGGSGAIQTFNKEGYYGQAEDYVYKVKKLANILTPEDSARYEIYKKKRKSQLSK